MRPPTDNALVLGNHREYRHKWQRQKLHSLGYIFAAESMVYLQTLLRNALRKLPNLVKWRKLGGYYAVQGHLRSSSLVPIESSYATSY